ncbi:MAG: porin family protein [Nitrosomonadales bacterium]|nr:porin family protein [Nitrosomonadales bacterium]
MRKVKIGMLAATVLASFSGATWADENVGMYIYGAVGQARVTADKGAMDAILTAAGVTGLSSSVKDTPTTYGMQLGYQFNQNWAVQAGYMASGNVEYRATGTNPAIIAADAKATAWNASAAGTMPFGSGFSGMGRLGVASVSVDESITATGPGGVGTAIASSKKTDITYGLGVKYDIAKNVTLRVDLDNYNAGTNDNGLNRFSVWSLGVGYKF